MLTFSHYHEISTLHEVGRSRTSDLPKLCQIAFVLFSYIDIYLLSQRMVYTLVCRFHSMRSWLSCEQRVVLPQQFNAIHSWDYLLSIFLLVIVMLVLGVHTLEYDCLHFACSPRHLTLRVACDLMYADTRDDSRLVVVWPCRCKFDQPLEGLQSNSTRNQ